RAIVSFLFIFFLIKFYIQSKSHTSGAGIDSIITSKAVTTTQIQFRIQSGVICDEQQVTPGKGDPDRLDMFVIRGEIIPRGYVLESYKISIFQPEIRPVLGGK